MTRRSVWILALLLMLVLVILYFGVIIALVTTGKLH